MAAALGAGDRSTGLDGHVHAPQAIKRNQAELARLHAGGE